MFHFGGCVLYPGVVFAVTRRGNNTGQFARGEYGWK